MTHDPKPLHNESFPKLSHSTQTQRNKPLTAQQTLELFESVFTGPVRDKVRLRHCVALALHMLTKDNVKGLDIISQ